MKKSLKVALLVITMLLVAWNSALAGNGNGKPPKPPKTDKVVIVHSGGHDNGNNPHDINVSCRARGHRNELGDAYCGKNRNQQPPEVIVIDPQVPNTSEQHNHNKPGDDAVVFTWTIEMSAGGGSAHKCVVY